MEARERDCIALHNYKQQDVVLVEEMFQFIFQNIDIGDDHDSQSIQKTPEKIINGISPFTSCVQFTAISQGQWGGETFIGGIFGKAIWELVP